MERNPLLVKRLKPGLDESRIRRTLARNKVSGATDTLVAVYSWRDGTILDPQLALSKSGFFPGKPFYLLDLEMAVADYDYTKVASRRHPELKEGTSYFPLFWNGSTDWLTVDLGAARDSRVILAQHTAPVPFREVFSSFTEFLEAGLKSLETGDALPL